MVGHESLEHAAGLLCHLRIMLLDLDRQGNLGIQRIDFDHGREQGEPFEVAVEPSRKENRALQYRGRKVVLFGGNENGLHGRTPSSDVSRFRIIVRKSGKSASKSANKSANKSATCEAAPDGGHGAGNGAGL